METNEARDFDKLQAHPVEIEISIGGQIIKAWLHSLPDTQTIHAISVYGEQKDMLILDGQDEDRAKNMALLALEIQTLLHAVKMGAKRDSQQLFKNAREILSLAPDEKQKISETYAKHFDMTQDQLGNSLRARIDTWSMRSSLPAFSRGN